MSNGAAATTGSNGYHTKVTAAMLLVTLGIIYGDIGTSPLYVFKAIMGVTPITESLVLGGISCIFWTLTMQTTIKYVLLTLNADNRGEGGILALYALVRKKRKWLVFPAIIGASTLLADGLITPPISVSSAIEGLPLLHKSFDWFPAEKINTVPIVCIILGLLFMLQRLGTKVVGAAFGPIMAIWFTMLGVLGTMWIVQNPMVLKALNPYYAYQLLFTTGIKGFLVLGAVFLCTTGAEALYSDLGHCGKENIRLTWGFVKIMLVLNYLGQGAFLLQEHTGDVVNVWKAEKGHWGYELLINPFYDMMPTAFLPIGIIIATLAAIIASQALITGSFTLIAEAMRLNLWIKHKVVYPSDSQGQIYVPVINLGLAIGCIAVTIFFRESSNMEAAYGLSICLTMLMTSILIVFYMLNTHIVPRPFVVGYMIVHGTIELAFLGANMEKFFEGGYVTLLIAGTIAIIMYAMYRGRQIRNKHLEFVDIKKYINNIRQLSKDTTIPKHATHLVYLTKANDLEQVEKKVIHSIFESQPKRADVYWLLHVDSCDDPKRCECTITTLAKDDLIRVDFKLGFRTEQQIGQMFKLVLEKMVTKQIKHGGIAFDSPYGDVLHPAGVDEEEVLFEIDPEDEDETKERAEKVKVTPKTGDYRFIVIEKIVSPENDLPGLDKFVLDLYGVLKHLSISDISSFNLDKSTVTLEQYPLIVTKQKEVEFDSVDCKKHEL
jgi:KUP system potassium uptake protein